MSEENDQKLKPSEAGCEQRACSPSWVWSERDQQWDLKYPGGPSHATVWPNGTWHTWNAIGIGGENSVVDKRFRDYLDLHHEAKREAWESCEKQGFIPANIGRVDMAEILGEALQDEWNDHVGDCGTIPPAFEVDGSPRTFITAHFKGSTFVRHVAELLESRGFTLSGNAAADRAAVGG
jgi:hypothetical protein